MAGREQGVDPGSGRRWRRAAAQRASGIAVLAAVVLAALWVAGPLRTAQAPVEPLEKGEKAEEAEEAGLPLGAPADLSYAEAADRPYETGNPDEGRAGSGGRAVAYRSGGRLVTSDSVTAQAPEARLFRTGFGSWEPSIGIDKQGAIFFSARNNNIDPGVAHSTDGGLTWTRSNPDLHKASLDPFIWVDRDTGRVFTSDISPTITCPPMSYTDDRGKSWATSAVCGHADYQKVFGGPPPAGGEPTEGYPNVVYFCAISGGIGAGAPNYNACSKSLDGGKSFELTGDFSYPPRAAPPGSAAPVCDGGAPPGVVDAKGTIYLPRGWCGEPYLAISKDEGATWTRTKVADKPLPYDPENAAWANDSGVAVDERGALYYVWVADDRRPYLTISRDGGGSWSSPLDLLPPGVTRTQNPAIDVGAPGRIAVSFVGTRDPKDAPAEDTTWDGYIAQSTNVLDEDPVFYAASVNDSERNVLWKGACSVIRCGNMGDFYDVTIGPDGAPRAAFVDSCPNGDECTSFGVNNPRGEGVMGQLAGGPPLVGTVADQRPGVTLPKASRRCRTRRTLAVRLRQPRRGKLQSARVYVDRKVVSVRRGKRLRTRFRVRLPSLRRQRFTLRVVATTTSGRRVVRTARYRSCTTKKRAPRRRR